MKVTSKFLLSALCALALVGCDNSKTVSKSDSKFSLISDKCQLIGAINIEEIAKIEGIQKLAQENQSIPYYKEIKAAGLGIENLNALYFGAEIPDNANQANLQSQGVFLLVAKSKISLPDFIALAEKSNNVKFKIETIGTKQAYIISDDSNLNPSTYIVQLNDTVIAVGTKNEAISTVSLYDNPGKSVLDNAGLMKVANNAQNKDMVWFAASVPPEVNKSNDPNSPDINDLFITMNYNNDTIMMDGKAVCATEQDVQKIMMPAQILTSMAVMSSNNTIKPEDLVLKADKNSFIISIKLSKAALKYMIEKSTQQAQAVSAETDVITEKVTPTAPVITPTPTALSVPVVPKAPVAAPTTVTTTVAAPAATTTVTTTVTTPVTTNTKAVSDPAPAPTAPVAPSAPIQPKAN